METDTKMMWKKLGDEWNSPKGLIAIIIFGIIVTVFLLIPPDNKPPSGLEQLNARLDTLNYLPTYVKRQMEIYDKKLDFLVGVEQKLIKNDKAEVRWVSDEKIAKNSRVFMFDGCEYVRFSLGTASDRNERGYMAHKGNCTNPIHASTINKALDSMYTEAQGRMKLINSLRR